MRKIKAIETIYNNVVFRSKLEAAWAKWFDQNNIPWSYETEGVSLDGDWYLPDFFLPEINTIVEVKGLLKGLEKAVKLALALKEHNLTSAKEEVKKTPDQYQWMGSSDWAENISWSSPDYFFLLGGSPVPSFYDIYDDWLEMGKCSACGSVWFCLGTRSYHCRSCGFHNGKHDLTERWARLHNPINFGTKYHLLLPPLQWVKQIEEALGQKWL